MKVSGPIRREFIVCESAGIATGETADCPGVPAMDDVGARTKLAAFRVQQLQDYRIDLHMGVVFRLRQPNCEARQGNRVASTLRDK